MKLKNKLILLGILVGVISCLGMNNSQASEITSVFSGKTITRNTVQNVELASENNASLVPVILGISKDRESGNWYVWNPLTTALDEKGNLKVEDKNNIQAQKAWKIAQYSSISSNTRDYSNLYYCLNAERGFGLSTNGMAEGTKDKYSDAFNMKDASKKSDITDYSGGKLGDNYNEVLWILDNSYIPTKSEKYQESSEYINLMKVAEISIDNKDKRLNLTEDDIEVVQQMAIWYFTNSESANYKNDNLPSLYINGTQLSSIYFYTTEDGEQITAKYRQKKAEKLFDYFITNADANYTVKTPTLGLDNTNVTIVEDSNNYIVGPFSLTGTNTDLIKEITATLNANDTLLNATLLKNSSKEVVTDNALEVVTDNAFSKVIGSNFYLEIAKNEISSNSTKITIKLTYRYDEKDLTFLTNVEKQTNTQPVVLVKSTEKTSEIEIDTTIELTSVTVKKIWSDNNNSNGKRPTSIQVQLYKKVNDKESKVGEPITLTSDNKSREDENCWIGTWEKLPKYENGEEITYIVKEKTIPDEYKATYSDDTFTITNTYTSGMTSKKVIKVWDDENNKDELRPDSVTVTLYKTVDEEKTKIESRVLNEENDWEHEWSKLAKKENEKDIIYSVEEDAVENYTTTYSSENYQNVDEITITNTLISAEKKLDLALRKFITKVNDIEYSREPVVDTSSIAETGTATYKHIKQPIPVQKGDVVTYTIRVYNEGEIDGYVDKITDYIPDHLLPIITGVDGIDEKKYSKEIDFNANWGWNISEDGKSVITMKTSKVKSETYSLMDGYEKVEDTKLNAYVEGSKKLDYIDVQIKCLVETSNEILTGQYLTNIAEITEMCDGNGTSIETDRDSKKGNVVCDNLLDYKNEEALISTTDSYVPGQEDDDDFEKLVIQVYDLSLRKFITNVSRNGVAVNIGVSREPVVDTTSLVNKTSTTADYKHKKDPIEVRVGDIVTYTIRVYNEGSINGIPAEITEYIPTYLDFDPNDELNKKYGWNLKDDYNNNGVGILTTSYLKDTVLEACSYQEGAELDNTNNHEAGDLKINFIVSGRPSQHTIMTNTSEISIYQYEDKTTANDRDSGEQWEIGILEYGVNLMNKSLYDNYVKTGEITQEKANEISDYVKNIFVDYKPDYASEDYGISDYLDSKGITGEEFIKNAPEGVPDEILNQAYNVINNKNSNKEITQAYASYIDEFFQSYKGIASNKLDLTDSKYYYAGQEDDDDFEKLKIVYFDLALRKFITKVNSIDYNNRYPEIKFNDDGSITYNHTKDPVLVATGDTVIYTIRVYNEGEVAGYATGIKDNLPEGLEFDPNNETNKSYGWKMIDKDGNVTEDVDKVVAFTTNHLEKEIIDPLIELNGSKILSYKDVQIAFKVIESNKSDRILVNTAEISADSDDDIDSTPNNNVESEDDIDKEYVKVEYFDLSLKKWVTETIVTLDGKTTTTKTGFTPDSEGVAKVDIVASKLKKTTVKFKYSIKVTNEGELPGYAYEVKDYIPSGLKFVAEDNKNWEEVKDNVVVTDQLKDTLLNPGESATVEIVLTWKNSSTNLGTKTNYAEISKDSGDDIDSTPDNFNLKEDDIDDAQVILSIKTAGKTTYVGLILISIIVLAGGVYGIKKYVLK